ncbi:hypothetical protein NL676_019181 [Syzygium grande]|nr:hypothetical protein NL676_019181 [Syzygium grande]
MLFKAVRHARPPSPPPTNHSAGNHPGGGGGGGGDLLVNPCLASLLLPALHCFVFRASVSSRASSFLLLSCFLRGKWRIANLRT